jgi:hypothetical protein
MQVLVSEVEGMGLGHPIANSTEKSVESGLHPERRVHLGSLSKRNVQGSFSSKLYECIKRRPNAFVSGFQTRCRLEISKTRREKSSLQFHPNH